MDIRAGLIDKDWRGEGKVIVEIGMGMGGGLVWLSGEHVACVGVCCAVRVCGGVCGGGWGWIIDVEC